MNFFKRHLAILACIIVCFTMAGCGEKKSEPTIKVIDAELTEEEYAFGVDKDDTELLALVNKFIGSVKNDGTLDEICNHYFGDGIASAVAPAEYDAGRDQLIVATNAEFEPFEYTVGDKYSGIDMELAAKLASYLDRELVIVNMDFDDVCESVSRHECDIAIAGLTKSEAREKFVTFSDSYYNASQKLLAMSDDTRFDGATDAIEVEELLRGLDESVRVGVQEGTTGQYYCEGDEDWGFEGLPVTCVHYPDAVSAAEDMIKGSIDYVIIDSAPAKSIAGSVK